MARGHWLLLACFIPVLAGCTTTASRELVVSVQNYDARSREAIDAVALIEAKALEQPPVPAADAERQFVKDILDKRLKFDGSILDSKGHPIDPAILVARRVHPMAVSIDAPPVVPGLEEMRCVHQRFTAAFKDVEKAGIFGKKPVASQAPEFLDQLIAQQLLLARLVQGPSKADLRGQKSALIDEIDRVRNASGDDAQKTQLILSLRTRWLAIEAEEAKLTGDAVAQLVKAGATGLALRDQLAAYGKWSLSDLADSARGLTAFVGATSGQDLSRLSGRIDELRTRIEQDPDFAASATMILATIPAPTAPTIGTAHAQPADATATTGNSPTPCLDLARGNRAAVEGANNGQ